MLSEVFRSVDCVPLLTVLMISQVPQVVNPSFESFSKKVLDVPGHLSPWPAGALTADHGPPSDPPGPVRLMTYNPPFRHRGVVYTP